MTKINSYWNNIFEKYKILEQIDKDGKFEISSSQINEFKEARLMTKFDNASQLPQIFKENELSILPITRGNYIIAPMDIFYKFPMIEYSNEISKIFKRFPQLNVSEVARYVGINKSLLAKYIYGIKKPSEERVMQIKEALHILGQQLIAV